ncbi:MAG: ATP-binding protein [Chloroflexota bacterium]
MIGYLLPPCILVFSSLVLLVTVIIAARNKTSAHWLFVLYLLALMAYGSIIYSMRASPDLDSAYAWERMIVGALPFLSTLLCHFCLVFSRARSYKWPLVAVYVIAAVFMIPQIAPLVVSGMQLKPYGYAPVFGGPLSYLWMPYLFGPAIWALVVLIRRQRREVSAEHRNRLSYVIAGLSLSMVGGIFDVLPVFGLPLYPGAIIGLIIFCILTALAIARYHLLDIQIIIRRGTAYLIMSAIVGIPYAAAVLTLNYYLSQLSEIIIVYVLLLIAGAIGLQPLWRWAQDVVDRMFYRGRYDFLAMLTKLTIKTYSIEQVPELARNASELLCKALQCNECRILIRETSSLKDMATPDPLKQAAISLDNPLVSWMETHEGIVRRNQLQLHPQLLGMTNQQAQVIASLEAELYVPVKTMEERLVAIVAVGRKRSGTPYGLDEEKILQDAASRLAVNLENAYLYTAERSLRESLEKETSSRSQFLMAVAHEMRTPLTSIIASSELLAEEIPFDPSNPRSNLVDSVRVSALILNRRVAELLDFARLKSANLELQMGNVDLSKIVETSLRQLDPVFLQKGQTYRNTIPSGLPVVSADAARIEQVVLNLLSNASKFSPRDAVIGIAAEVQHDRVVVSISDEAIPLSELERSRLFEPYYRGDNPNRLTTGLGLGLAISKQLIERHNGKIWVESHTSGNVFYFSLPVSA